MVTSHFFGKLNRVEAKQNGCFFSKYGLTYFDLPKNTILHHVTTDSIYSKRGDLINSVVLLKLA